MIKVFFCEPTGEFIFTKMWWCKTCNGVGLRKEVGRGTEEDFTKLEWENEPDVPCETCGNMARFSCRGTKSIYRRKDTGELIMSLTDHPGACYEEEDGAWDHTSRTKRFGPDGRALNVVLPDKRIWSIDSRASNCTLPNDNDHRCWVRRGSPEVGDLHVDKNGHTCQAGGGSIATKTFHGFLHDGFIKSC